MKFSHQHGFIDRESYVAQYLALAIFITGVVNTVGSDDLLAAFAAGRYLRWFFSATCLLYCTFTGSAISWDGDFNIHTEGEVFASVIDLVLNCACFIYIGAWLPFQAFSIPEIGITPSKLVLLTVGIMYLRRIPAILVLYKFIPEITTWKEAVFSGHFGTEYLTTIEDSLLTLSRSHGRWSCIHLNSCSSQAPGTGQPTSDTTGLSRHSPPTNRFICGTCVHNNSWVIFRHHLFLVFHIGADGLSIPFFNLSRTVSLSNTLTKNSTKLYPEWLLGVKRSPSLPTEPDQIFTGPVPLPISTSHSEGVITAKHSAIALPSREPKIVSVIPSSSKNDEGTENVESKRVSVNPILVSASESNTRSPADITEELRLESEESPTELRIPKAVHFPSAQ